MTIRDVRIFGDPVLTTPAEKVTEFDESLAILVQDMLHTMDAHDGVGLAANQVGVTRRVFVYDCSHVEGGQRGHIINPVWTPVGEQTQTGKEGCLSIPDVSVPATRYNTVQLSGRDLNGNPVSLLASGLMARCIQHETDHLDGVLFLKRLDPETRKSAMREIRNSTWFNS
ncbi:peptide deformylase [Corynebacterium halotolerans]|uniref:peptide deformylase n=1 Tax=Corynebacterium halotolerans TaxID=225326 RepID=UPI003CFB59DB